MCVLALAPVRLPAQDARGRILGRVTDATSAVVPGASVTVTQLDKNTHVTTRANNDGNYDLQYLLPGPYQIDVQAAGFKSYSRHPIEVHVGDVITIDVKLEVGTISQRMDITAEAPLVDESTASLSKLVEHKELEDLPLGGGDVMFLTQMAAGVTTAQTPGHNWLPSANDVMSNVNIDGTSNHSNEYTLDGISNMERGMVSFTPPADMVQEVRIQTTSYDASLGHAAGGTIAMSLKSGTNQLHGTANWDVAPNPWQANDFFQNQQIFNLATGPVTPAKIAQLAPPRKVNRYSATIGAPVFIPKIYDGKNRTFWTYGFQGFNRRNPNTTFNTVPTAAERAGDFSALLPVGSVYQIYDPMTTRAVGNGRFSRQPFAGNIIPASRISPLSANYTKFFPQPNLPGTIDGRQNFEVSAPNNNDFLQNMARIDHNISDRNRIFGRFTESWLHFYHGNIFDNASHGIDRHRLQWGGGLDDVYTFSPTLILNVKYGFTRYTQSDFAFSKGYNLGSLGLPASLVNQLDQPNAAFPYIQFNGFTGLGEKPGNAARIFVTDYQTLAGGFTKIVGNHSVRWGGEFRNLRENTADYGNVSPAMNFQSAYTKGPLDNSPGAPIGQDLATLLLGIPSGGSIDLNANYSEQSNFAGLYVQDDWKVTRRLTLNLGIRWEYETGPTERYNRTARGFDPSVVSPIAAEALAAYAAHPDASVPVSQFSTMGALTFAGVNGAPRDYFNTGATNFAPRFGLAYRLTNKTVLRAGYGMFYDTIGINQNHAKQEGFSQTTNLIPTIDNGITYQASLGNPFPNGLLQPGAVGPSTYIGRAISFFPAELLTPYMQRWSFSIQRELPMRSLVEVSYVGNKGTHLTTSREIDSTPAQYLSTLPYRDQNTINYVSAAVPNPFYGIPEFAGGGITGQNISRGNLLRPYPQFNGITYMDANGESWYHSLQVHYEKRWNHGFLINFDYTWSKFMDATDYLNNSDLMPTHVVAANDRPHRVVPSGIYELPFGHERKWLNNAPELVNAIAGGWQYQAIFIWQSGPPIGFGNIIFNGDLADMVLPRDQRTPSEWFNVNAGFDRNPADVLADNIRAFPLRLTGLRADGQNYWEMSMYKQFVVRERLRVQIRTDWEGALNTPNFSAPNAAPTNTAFGRVTSVQGEARRIFVGAKILF